MAAKTYVITGASRGIGLATALRFAKSGANIVLAARNENQLREAEGKVRAAGATCAHVVGDVSEPGVAERLIAAAVERFGGVDVLVNNAGHAELKPIDETTLDDFNRTIAANVRAVFCVTRAAWPVMKGQRRGVIVNISSVASVTPFHGFSVYGASKAWVNVFSQATAEEGKPLGIRVYVVAPGAVETRMLRQAFPDLAAEHVLDPDDIAAAIEAACDERMKYSVGQPIFVRK